jgi:hypothetical protein
MRIPWNFISWIAGIVITILVAWMMLTVVIMQVNTIPSNVTTLW